MLMIQVEHYLHSAMNDNAELADRYDRYAGAMHSLGCMTIMFSMTLVNQGGRVDAYGKKRWGREREGREDLSAK